MTYTPVTRDRLELFLQRLGRVYRGAGRVYLVGGTSLLYNGLKVSTKDIDLSADYRLKFDAFLMRAKSIQPPTAWTDPQQDDEG